MDVLSILVFLVIIVMSFFRKMNLGILAFAAALVLGRIMGVADKEIVKGLSQSLFVTLAGITLLFSAVSATGVLDLISKKVISLVGNRIWVFPFVMYLLGITLAVIGPGAIPPTTLVVTLCVTIALAAGYSPVMMSIIGVMGLMGGRVSAITPEGTLVTTLGAEQGLTGGVVFPVFAFQVITTALFALFIFFAFKGYQVKTSAQDVKLTEKVNFTKNQIVALVSILVMIVMVTVFKIDVGLCCFVIAGILFLFDISEDSSTVKAMPWATIIMILGVGVLMNVINLAGGIDLICNSLASFMTKSTAAPFIGITAGIMSLVSSGFGVVYPTLVPMATQLAETAGGAQPASLIAAIIAGGSLAGLSPMSTCGALTLSTTVALKKDLSKTAQSKMFMQMLIAAVCSIIWVGISAALFGNLCVNLFG